ncbi:MAG: YicC family protein [Kyrpidia sp.]|nr:YicC family protein [Kyrpidia sp.]
MLRSMTGYGRGTRKEGGFTVTVEIRTVNHRFREIVVRGPREWLVLEDDLRRLVAEQVDRGRVDVYITVEPGQAAEGKAVLDISLAKAVKEAADRLAEELGLRDRVGMAELLAVPGMVRPEEPAVDPETGRAAAEAALREALAMLVSARSAEGQRLEQDIRRRLTVVRRLADDIRARASVVPEEYRRRLMERLREWNVDASLDEGRLTAEAALFADRASIEEELVRLASHFAQFEAAVATGGSVGRRLDFLLQEMFRELNTIGAKAPDAEITARVVDAKVVLEQLREQVQNVE